MMYPIILPIYHSSGSGLSNYTYPHWVELLMFSSFMAVVVGLITLIAVLLADTCFDIDIDVLFKMSIFVTFTGAIFMLVGLVCMMLTGQPIE